MTAPGANGGRILVDSLLQHGVDLAFCVPGESYLEVISALADVKDRIRLIVTRHEAAAANMAEACGKLTGRPGICFVTRGPGASHAAIGLHTAFQDSTPLILFIGQIHREHTEREAFQEIDYAGMFGPMAKWVATVNHAERIPEMVSRAFHLAVSGRPGPVVLALPEDMLAEHAEVRAAQRYSVVRPAPRPEDVGRLREMLGAAERPVMIVGGSGWSAAACQDLQSFAEAHWVPTAAAFRFQDVFDNRHPLYCGDAGLGINPALAARIREADLLLVVGARLGEATTSGYSLVEIPRPRQTFVHVHAGIEELGRVYQGDLLINSGMPEFVAALRGSQPLAISPGRRVWAEALRNSYLDWIQPRSATTAFDFGRIMAEARERLPRDAIITNGAGNFTTWIHRYYQYRPFHTQLAPTSGAMGYGLPAGIAAALVHPDRLVVNFNGDGCFMMNCQELATAVLYRLPLIIVILNNSSYGTIRMHQERSEPGSNYATDLLNPDFVAFARSFGIPGELVETTEDFWPAFERARAAGGPALIEVKQDIEEISARETLTELRAKASRR